MALRGGEAEGGKQSSGRCCREAPHAGMATSLVEEGQEEACSDLLPSLLHHLSLFSQSAAASCSPLSAEQLQSNQSGPWTPAAFICRHKQLRSAETPSSWQMWRFYCDEEVPGLFFMCTCHASCQNQPRQVLLCPEEQSGTWTLAELKALVKKNGGRPLQPGCYRGL